jgi:ER membrane protein complex subunit 7
LRVDVSSSGEGKDTEVQVWGTFRGNEWANKGEEVVVRKVGDGIWVFEVKVGAEREYFLERAGCKSSFFLQPTC